MGANTLSDQHMELLTRIERDYLRGLLRVRPPGKRPQRPQPPGRPNIRAILLDDLTNVGTVDAAVTVLEQTNEVQAIRLLGRVTSGSFPLQWRPPPGTESYASAVGTGPGGNIPYDASAYDVQLAMETGMPSINRGDIRVTKPAPGTWLVTFMGQYADVDVELILTGNFPSGLFGLGTSLGGTFPDIEVIGSSWIDTGRTEKVRLGLPIVDDVLSPIKQGAVVVCLWIHTAGYCVIAAECRDVEVIEGYGL